MKKSQIWMIAVLVIALLLIGVIVGLRSCGGEPGVTQPSVAPTGEVPTESFNPKADAPEETEAISPY